MSVFCYELCWFGFENSQCGKAAHLASIAVSRVGTAARITLAHCLANGGAGMGSKRGRDGVGLPDVHFRAARSVATDTGIGVVCGRRPSINVGLSDRLLGAPNPKKKKKKKKKKKGARGCKKRDITYLAVDELQVARTLRVTVSSAVLGTSSVVGILGHAAVLVHRDKVEGAVEAAREVRHVNIERELVSEQGEHCGERTLC
jgi:hypothetical protein